MLYILKKQWFTIALVTSLVLGVVLSDLVLPLNPGGIVTSIVVVIMFFNMGLTLPAETIVAGVGNIKVHFYIQFFIFIFVPLYFTLAMFLLKNLINPVVATGILALSCLPTTISTCSVFTQLSEGNSVVTMFNASLSNIAGIIISPLLLSFILKDSGHSLPRGEMLSMFQGLAMKMLLPIGVGQLLRLLLKDFAVKHKKKIGLTNNVLILVIVFFTISMTATNPDFTKSLTGTVVPFLFLALSHYLLVFFAYQGGKLFGIKGKELISIVFAAPQKTLAVGVPLLSTWFAGTPEILGIAILPLLFYHSWQLFTAGILKGLPAIEALRGENP